MSWFCIVLIGFYSRFCLILFFLRRAKPLHRNKHMDKMFSADITAPDCRLSMASIAGVYSPLILILIAALVVF